MTTQSWQNHYTKKKSELAYPDENLVRMVSVYLRNRGVTKPVCAVDLGCGSGRHMKLLADFSVDRIIGLDNSFNALSIARNASSCPVIQADNSGIPLKDESADIVIAWGSLHYDHKDRLPGMLKEIHRVLKPEGRLFATLRSSRDTMLKSGRHLGNNVWETDLNDISGALISVFSEDELSGFFPAFSQMKYGLMERTIPGDMNSLVSHWIIQAVR
jgi:ubiquinone/menaquinone biosynthesis C-methylase UbiE